MTPDEKRPDSSLASSQVPATARGDARAAVAAIARLAGRLADTHLSAADRSDAVEGIRKQCRRLLRLLGGRTETPAPSTPPPAMPRPRVLVAEDCPNSRQAVCSFLTHAGLDVTPAENGRVAIALSRTGKFDLVLLDMQMPEVDGYEAARRLRNDGYRGPVIALTGDVQPGDEQACHEAGCDAYFAKPWDPDQLLKALREYLGLNRTRPKEDPVATTLRSDPTLQQLAGEFARSLPRTIAEMTAAFAAGDRRQVGKLAHQASGAAGMFGFPEVCKAARQLSTAAAEGGEDDARLDERIRALAELTRKIGQSPAGGA
jgi:CheY-like chemotaxis protein/HPt (histidine-containing phosphotransfer) domain-containing protein